ncbi:ammonia monooxygenase [Neorhizobium sp. SOG26]|uniref:AbrB family transcriptional regulator n=1 Tax=Neorhizobium sp. SOG26 TaxID=2060726 RepID=UPI000E57FDB5|nr:AbrB family transcriptional regulator [Neorhizobium sp. SOG26]AXV17190.1 ammonia monooxygenase [Neorhizobium sp. SOG26]
MSPSELRAFALTAAIGFAGALLAILISFPAPYLIGPAIAVTLASLAGLRLAVPQNVRNVCFVIVGVSMGTTVTPEVIVAARTWPMSFVMVLVTMTVLLFTSSTLLQRLFGYDRVTSLLASSPGHLSYVLSLAAETRCDVRTVSIAQSVRVLALTIITPIIVTVLDLVDSGTILAVPVMSLPVLIGSLVAAVALGALFLRLRLPAALLLGGVFVSIATHVTGFASGAVPNWLLIPTYVILGALIGTRFSGVSLAEVKKAAIAGAVATVAVTFIAVATAFGVSHMLDIPLDAALIAFAPGGLETMSAMAVMLDANPTYVGAHHVLRLLFLSALMPLALARAVRQR